MRLVGGRAAGTREPAMTRDGGRSLRLGDKETRANDIGISSVPSFHFSNRVRLAAVGVGGRIGERMTTMGPVATLRERDGGRASGWTGKDTWLGADGQSDGDETDEQHAGIKQQACCCGNSGEQMEEGRLA